jgi:periplasmic protein TonB
VASAPSALRSPAIATPTTATPGARPAADVTAITTSDDFLLELGQALGGRAAVRPVDSLDAALAAMASARRAQVLVIDARDVADVRAAAEAAYSQAHAAVVVFDENAAGQAGGGPLEAAGMFTLLPLPMDAGRTQTALEEAIAAAVANRSATPVTAAAHGAAAAVGSRALPGALPAEPAPVRTLPAGLLLGGAVALAVIAAATFWFLTHGGHAPAASARSAAVPTSVPGAQAPRAPAAAETSLVQGKLDELLEKARLAMHERRFSEPVGDNALLYYRSAAAVDPASAEAHDGLQRVAGVLAGRFEEALTGARLEEAAATLASFKSAAPGDARIAAFEQRLYTGQITRAFSDGNLDRAAAVLHQAQQAGVVGAEQLARWRGEIGRRQEEAKVQHFTGLIDDRIRDGRLVEADDSALTYLQQLQAAAPANPATQRAAHDLVSACLHKAHEAGLANNTAEQERWVAAARAAGAKSADISAFQKDLANARAKAAQAESERLLQLARERLHEGRLTDPAQDSAAAYLTQLQASDAANPGLAGAGHELSKALLDRARAAVLAGKSDDADLALAKRWGADPKELAAVQQLQPAAASAPIDPAALAASLKRLRSLPPDYPPNALAQRISGSVLLEFTVDTRGEPRDISVLEASPPHVFDQAAINAIKHWRYAPMIVNGTAVEVPVKTRMRFELPK